MTALRDEQDLTLRLGTISYKEAKGIPVPYVLSLNNSDYYSNAICSTVFLQTRDGYILIGKSGKRDLFIGGGYSPEEEDLQTGEDIYAGAYREVIEELGIAKEHIEDLSLQGAVRMSSLNVAFIFHGYLTLSKKEVCAYFQKRPDPELDDLSFIKTSDFPAYMALKHSEKKVLLDCISSYV